ncbi:hypothetical protein DL546_008711 [Coniochaeta pulveracea]|uniref:Rhodanese domain-containing protein n=1 Tax=Coniochaeta pulveracea TaxID=177199 RepID=A0A420YLZ7_9PEZI|nr:hypothetical protein DL546_008711 [Coniochaeta pulveracea]
MRVWSLLIVRTFRPSADPFYAFARGGAVSLIGLTTPVVLICGSGPAADWLRSRMFKQQVWLIHGGYVSGWSLKRPVCNGDSSCWGRNGGADHTWSRREDIIVPGSVFAG